MSDKGQKDTPHKKVSERDRLKFIGFEVYPGEPKDLFKSEAEKDKLVQEVRERREHHDHLRGDCTLLEERVSKTDRLVLTIASIITVLSLFLPWYSAYNEIVEEPKINKTVEVPVAVQAAETVPTGTTGTTPADSLAAAQTATSPADTAAAMPTEPANLDEVITSVMARKKIHKEYSRVSGLGAFLSFGTIGSYVFSSGLALMLSVVLFIVYTLLCIGIPLYNLYGIYGLKGDPDSKALKLKKMLRLNWIPLLIFVACLVLSFLGGDYSFNAAEVFTSIGDGYNPMVFLGSLTWGVYVSMACFILCAAKSAEI